MLRLDENLSRVRGQIAAAAVRSGARRGRHAGRSDQICRR